MVSIQAALTFWILALVLRVHGLGGSPILLGFVDHWLIGPDKPALVCRYQLMPDIFLPLRGPCAFFARILPPIIDAMGNRSTRRTHCDCDRLPYDHSRAHAGADARLDTIQTSRCQLEVAHPGTVFAGRGARCRAGDRRRCQISSLLENSPSHPEARHFSSGVWCRMASLRNISPIIARTRRCGCARTATDYPPQRMTGCGITKVPYTSWGGGGPSNPKPTGSSARALRNTRDGMSWPPSRRQSNSSCNSRPAKACAQMITGTPDRSSRRLPREALEPFHSSRQQNDKFDFKLINVI